MARVSSSTASPANCWPPMAWRPPAMHTALPSARAARSAARERRFRIDRDDAVDVGGIELGMDVVDLDARAGGARPPRERARLAAAARERKARRVGMIGSRALFPACRAGDRDEGAMRDRLGQDRLHQRALPTPSNAASASCCHGALEPWRGPRFQRRLDQRPAREVNRRTCAVHGLVRSSRPPRSQGAPCAAGQPGASAADRIVPGAVPATRALANSASTSGMRPAKAASTTPSSASADASATTASTSSSVDAVAPLRIQRKLADLAQAGAAIAAEQRNQAWRAPRR